MRHVKRLRPARRRERGFTMMELAIATLVLMIGVVGIAQLVPASLKFDANNRVDTTAMVLAQREMDQIINQPLTSTTFTDKDGNNISLGSTTVSDTVFGGPVVMLGTSTSINFGATAVANYNLTFTDPNDPTGPPYQMRWAVISKVNAGNVTSKRFIVGCYRNVAGQIMPPAVVDTMVEK